MDRNRNGGGIALYIRNSINYENIQPLNENLELLCVKVIKPKAKPFIVGTWYRHPGSPSEIMHASESALERLEQYDLETNILKDANCDIAASPLDHQSFSRSAIYINFNNQSTGTRKTVNTATKIDLFLINSPGEFSHTGISHIDISADHSLIYKQTMHSNSIFKYYIKQAI